MLFNLLPAEVDPIFACFGINLINMSQISFTSHPQVTYNLSTNHFHVIQMLSSCHPHVACISSTCCLHIIHTLPAYHQHVIHISCISHSQVIHMSSTMYPELIQKLSTIHLPFIHNRQKTFRFYPHFIQMSLYHPSVFKMSYKCDPQCGLHM